MADDDLTNAVLTLANDDESLSERGRLLILAALDSAQLLDEVIGGKAPPLAAVVAAQKVSAPPIGAYLRSIRVAGFRGVGAPVTLTLQPAPGLTVIAGRNGSGKSTIAEALEMALTGASYRWSKPASTMWTADWRNLHGAVPASIVVEVAEEGSGLTKIGVDWPKGAGLKECTAWVQRHGKKRQDGRGSLGWEAPLNLYRPMLSYDELGGVLEGSQSTLYDKLHVLLGLESITDGQQRLTAAMKRLQLPVTDAKVRGAELKPLLTESDDPRSAAALAQLKKHKPNINLVQTLATGGPTTDLAGGSTIAALAGISWPAQDRIAEVAARLRDSVAALAELADTAADASSRRAELLSQALALYGAEGDVDCPVCGQGRLDKDWAARATESLAEREAELAEIGSARSRQDAAAHDARALLTEVTQLPAIEDSGLTAMPAAASARAAWIAAPTNPFELAEHFLTTGSPLITAFGALRAQAERLAPSERTVGRRSR